jgi:hypothetical protein
VQVLAPAALTASSADTLTQSEISLLARVVQCLSNPFSSYAVQGLDQEWQKDKENVRDTRAERTEENKGKRE